MKVAYDTTLMRPACVLLAAGLGASTQAATAFDTEDWLLSLTSNMRVLDTTPEQLDKLIEWTARAKKKRAAERLTDRKNRDADH